MLFKTKVRLAKTTQKILRQAGRGGTSLPGKLLLRMEPNAIYHLSQSLQAGSIVISATNGKTTTANLLSQIFHVSGYTPLHNAAGANMAGGIATALMNAQTQQKANRPDIGIFEVDEFWLDQLLLQLNTRVVLLGNLFRDQLDRFGELETIADRWLAAIDNLPLDVKLIVNADDPLLSFLGSSHLERCTTYGLDDPKIALPSLPHAADSTRCRKCLQKLSYTAIYLGHLGDFFCQNCHTQRLTPQIRAQDIELHGLQGSSFTLVHHEQRQRIHLPLPGVYNIYNAVAAIAAATVFDISLSTVETVFQKTRAAFGRGEQMHYEGCLLTLLLAKNPTGANEILRTLLHEPEQLTLLSVLNDKTADGGDISWIWDVDYETLVPRTQKVICSGTRATEMALRWKYAGLESHQITVIPVLADALRQATKAANKRLFVLPTYTAMLELRQLLIQAGALDSSLATM